MLGYTKGMPMDRARPFNPGPDQLLVCNLCTDFIADVDAHYAYAHPDHGTD
jgi:hypothetical protein